MDVVQFLLENIVSFAVSFAVLVGFAIWQLCYFCPTRTALKKVSRIFSDDEYSIDKSDDAISIKYSKNNPTFTSVCGNINQYIKENSDNIDLNEMKDIANRLVDIEYEKASAKTSYPMYVGLMGTYIGVTIGLIQLICSVEYDVDAKERMLSMEGVYTFIGGVVIAMLTSFFGLALTTRANNLSAKNVAKLDADKDIFFTFLQAKVMPQLPSTLAQTLRDALKRSVESLGRTIGSLNNTVTSLNTELRDTFKGITEEFGDNLSRNLDGIQQTVNTLTESARSYAATMQVQDRILERLNSRTFVTAMNKINDTVDRCETTASTLQQAEERATNIVQQQDSIVALQERFNEVQTSAMERTVELHTQLSGIVLQSQESMNRLTNQPNEMFRFISETIAEFSSIARFVERYANQDMLQTNLGVQSINNQLDALQAAQDSITNFCTIAHRNLQQYLEQRQVEMDGVAENFVQSWINMFNRIQIHNGENPIAYLKQLSTIDQNISAIVSQKDILYQKLDDLKQLSTIDQNISTIVSQKDILYQKLDDIKDATGKGITGGTQPYRNAEMSNGPTQTEENDETQPANKEPGEGVGGKGGSRFWDWINRKK